MLGIYLHVPFCVKKCNYCDFTSVEGDDLVQRYLYSLEKEIELSAKLYPDSVNSIFIGGGTPGKLQKGEIPKILRALQNNFEILPDAEITIETNPCVVTAEKLDEYKASGINRISMGLQAAQGNMLKLLGRQHDLQTFDNAFDMARQAGFDNINVDVMYAIPGQSIENWTDTLYHVLYKKPEHISAYALSIEDGTPFSKLKEAGKINLVDEDTDFEMYELGQKLLSEKGYVNYEISNYASRGRVCLHNLKYWNLDDYLGLGAAAHSFVKKLRFSNTNDIKKYILQLESGSLHYDTSKYIGGKERKFEYIMLKLRLNSGISFVDFKKEFSVDFEEAFGEGIALAKKHGIAIVEDGRIRPTAKGFALQNQLAGIFLKTVNN